MNDKKMMQIVGAVQRTVGDDKKTWWTRIGVARRARLHRLARRTSARSRGARTMKRIG